MKRRLLARVGCAAAVLAGAGCQLGPGDSVEESQTARPRNSEATSGAEPATRAPNPGGRGQTDAKPVTIAFAGDVHFQGALASRLSDPRSALGPLSDRLADADLAIVNLESAVTERGIREPKEYTFQDPPQVFGALKAAGVDVVTMANNHALDYGPTSVPDALEAAREAGMPVIGIGHDADQAYRPWIVEVGGQRIAFLAATAVVDSSLVDTWSARPDQPGVATALDGNNAELVEAIEAVRPRVDTVVVDMHYGSDLLPCPTDIQRKVARDVVHAGADIVVGQHAHILLGAGYLGSAYVDYGMGNFQFYSAGGVTAITGVLMVTATGREINQPRWFPGVIVNGVPTALSGDAAAQAVERWRGLRGCTGLSAGPRR